MATIKKMPISLLVQELKTALDRKDGYIMGACGEDPSKWAKNSWWFTQYNDNAKQKEKALYWRSHAQHVWDCQGMCEGIYSKWAGTTVNVRARNNYATWCSPKGKGLIPADKRIPGAAVFWGPDNDSGSIHHVAYLYAPVDSKNPKGDWYIIEARGVMYGVVKTKLNSRKPNYWGYMTKYFDYEATETATPSEPIADPIGETIDKEPETVVTNESVVEVSRGNYYVRTEANSKSKDLGIAKKGTTLLYLGETKDKWYKVEFEGKTGWIHSNCGKIVENDHKTYLIVKKGSWNVRTGPGTSNKRLNTVHGGDKLEYLGKTENNWHYITNGKLTGWISNLAIEK